ncbi:hypothetical protein SORDD14_01538 [Streptococcus oralis]|uniref:Uncharacterized protein n=1 Tax=Streptococcus oralis TaxID=1303 RepID=A0A139NV19_STROR|nr:hypothetical protein SORDD14_01538 [Streptococcus oralis]
MGKDAKGNIESHRRFKRHFVTRKKMKKVDKYEKTVFCLFPRNEKKKV